MSLRHTIRNVLVLCFCLAAVGCGVGSPPNGQEATALALFDEDNTRVEVSAPVERVISVNSGMTTLICALGAQDALVGRDALSTFPSAALEAPVVAESSARCNLELVLSLNPDLVVADGMLSDEQRDKLSMSHIPSYVDSTSDPLRISTLIHNFGLALGKDQRANDLTTFVEKHVGMVEQRIAQLDLPEEKRPRVFLEWNSPLKTASSAVDLHKPIAQAGGANIAAEQPGRTPVVSSEWVIQQNPDVIIKRMSGDATIEEMKREYDKIIQRPGWDQINAVKNGRVHVIKSDVFLTFRYPVGLAYYAVWFYPEVFHDLDPEAIHQEVIEEFLGKSEWEMLVKREAFVYP